MWNDLTTNEKTNGGGGGGGPSSVFPKPFYQVGITPADSARDVPERVAHPPRRRTCPTTRWRTEHPPPVGGTSAATPSFAGILALVTQAVVTNGGPLGLGDVNPQLYTLFKSNPEAFHDIVTGTNDSPCLSSDPTDYPDCPVGGDYGGYPATTGYDLGTGLGSVDAAKLVAAWSVQANTTTTVAASATSTTVDTPVTLSAHVSRHGHGEHGERDGQPSPSTSRRTPAPRARCTPAATVASTRAGASAPSPSPPARPPAPT